MRLTLLPFLPLPLILALPSPISPDTHHLTPRQSDPAPGTGAGAGAGAAAGIASALSAIFAPFAALSGSGSGLGSGSSSSGSGSGFGSGSGSGGTIPTPARPPTDITYAKVAYADCGEGATGSNVSSVLVGPCEGGSGAEGSPCVFTQGRNYTIVITYTSPVSVPANQSRTGLASYDGDQRTAYSGQSFSACSYTDCPITAGVERNYTYPFRTFAAPNFQKLVFNATIGIQGQSFMCARVPVAFQPSS